MDMFVRGVSAKDFIQQHWKTRDKSGAKCRRYGQVIAPPVPTKKEIRTAVKGRGPTERFRLLVVCHEGFLGTKLPHPELLMLTLHGSTHQQFLNGGLFDCVSAKLEGVLRVVHKQITPW